EAQVTGVSFTHVALSVLFIIYSQRILRELFYNIPDFSNTLSDARVLANAALSASHTENIAEF
ncbi:MAG: hypothetical protein KME52_25080, partial [Desmonostoc geniculatum HA4340-LM1]|nr:hypothetical protein [Desmonostoc geniculatum HA4340-LM1]